MEGFSDFFVNNPNMFIMLFAGVLVLFLLVFIVVKVITNNKKKAMRNTGAYAELSFGETVRTASMLITDVQFQGYKLYSLNGEEPKIVGKSIFVPEGLCQVEIQYIDTGYATKKVSLTTIHEKQLLEFHVEKGKKYHIHFDKKTGTFEVKE
jgi:hypothetical protein